MQKILRSIAVFFLVITIGFAPTASVYAAKNRSPLFTQTQSQIVEFNTKTYKFHNPSCRAARACTHNCISISRTEAIRRGGVPCKICGGR